MKNAAHTVNVCHKFFCPTHRKVIFLYTLLTYATQNFCECRGHFTTLVQRLWPQCIKTSETFQYSGAKAMVTEWNWIKEILWCYVLIQYGTEMITFWGWALWFNFQATANWQTQFPLTTLGTNNFVIRITVGMCINLRYIENILW